MFQMTVSGIDLQEKMILKRCDRIPVIHLNKNIIIDDLIMEKPTLITGQVGSGKSYFLIHKILPQIFSQMSQKDSTVIFATKREMIDGFYNPEQGDILFEYAAENPYNIWNIFAEMEASEDARKTLSELSDMIFYRHKNKVQPFFTNAPKDMFKSLTWYLYCYYERKTGKKPNNGTLIGFINTLTLKDVVINGKTQKGLLTLIKEVQELNHLTDYLGDGKTSQSLGVLGEFQAVIRETFQGGAFVKAGTFSAREALKKGRKIFLLYDFSESTQSSMAFFDMLLDQMIKISLKENKQRVWFILDEFSLIGHLQYLEQAMSFGRANGFRMIAAIQSVQLMEKNYSKEEADCILSLFPNIFCFFTSDYKTRGLISNRYGNKIVSVVGIGNQKPVLMEQKTIQDSDFYKITQAGQCIVSLAGYLPFFF